jgi:hypothetical protein
MLLLVHLALEFGQRYPRLARGLAGFPERPSASRQRVHVGRHDGPEAAGRELLDVPPLGATATHGTDVRAGLLHELLHEQ